MPKLPFIALGLASLLTLSACSEETCGVAGTTQACLCTTGAMGAQSCQADGTFSACVCAGPSVDAGAPDSGTTSPVSGPSGDFVWDFEDGTLQGFAIIANDASAGMALREGEIADGFALEPIDFNGARESHHDLVVIRSPAFHLDASSPIRARVTGGVGDGSSPANTEALARNSAESGSHHLGIAVRSAVTGEYLAYGRRAAVGDWADIVIAPDELAAADRELVTVDVIDAFGGEAWSWLVVDDVRAAGWAGDGECDPNPCAAGVSCTDEPGRFPGFACGDCPAGSSGDGRVCTEDPPTIGADCTDTPCSAGLTCVGTPRDGRRCFEPCETAPECMDSFRNACLEIARAGDGPPLSFCLRRSQENEGCGYVGSEQGRCDEDLFCDPESATCVPIRRELEEGQVCREDEVVDGEVIGCSDGLTCLGFGHEVQACHQVCDPTGDGECTRPGTTCIPALSNAQGVCLDVDCVSSTDCAFPGYVCASDSGFPWNICVPPVPPGQAAYGDVCRETLSGSRPATRCSTDPNNGGLADARCLATDPSSREGFCSRECTEDRTCPDYVRAGRRIPAECRELGNGISLSLCVFRCPDCPDGLVCDPSFPADFCIAP